MSFLLENSSQNLAARITNKGRKKIAQGNFNISYFQIGDSEFDYSFSDFNGITGPSQKVLMPLDKDSQVKYPYKLSESTLTGTTFGTPIQSSYTETIKNYMGPAGYVSEWIEYDGINGVGTSVICDFEEIDIWVVNGTNILSVTSGSTFNDTVYITLLLGTLIGANNLISDSVISSVFKITEIVGNTLILDRTMPDLSFLSPYRATVIRNSCTFSPASPEDQQDPWTLSTVWSNASAGLGIYPDEDLSGYTSNIFVSTKEFFGYNSSSGQTYNTGTTITNSFGDIIIVSPEEQHSLGIIHYSKASDILTDSDLAFKYEDYIAHTDSDDIEYFEVYIPFFLYERNTGTTIGARFFMDTTDYYINSAASDTRINQMKFRYLLDENDNKIGKIFVNHKVIIFDDQEIVAALDYKTNRRFTLPIPRAAIIPIDSKCDVDGDFNNPLIGGTGDTIFVTYLLEYSNDISFDGMHCNHYCKITGTTSPGDVSIKFNSLDFKYLVTSPGPLGYIADRFKILAQKVTTGEQPDPSAWRIMDFTDQIPDLQIGDTIPPTYMRNTRFIITNADYENGTLYDIENYMDSIPDEPSTEPEFGDEQPFTGSIKLVRATDMEVMRFLVNLPSGDFTTTQNPSYSYGKDKRITEVALLDDNKDVMVIAKASSPVIRTGSQVLGVKIDI
jgi:hypothetical protein